ncbi:YwpF family protein [Bacillaceae bacterium W0354]
MKGRWMMKTFKLVSLEILEKSGEDLINKQIPLKDGLIIDREVDQNRWLLECLIGKDIADYFNEKKQLGRELVIQVRITKETNPKATIVAKILSVNNIEKDANVILKGNIVNREREQVEKMLQELIEAGYQGESLLKKFKEKNQESLF